MPTPPTGKNRSSKMEILCNLPKYPHFATVKQVAHDARCDERKTLQVLRHWSRAGKVMVTPSTKGDLACITPEHWDDLTARAGRHFDVRYAIDG